MHLSEPAKTAADDSASGPWYRGLTGYHWFVFIVAALGWLFDTMDQQLFVLARTCNDGGKSDVLWQPGKMRSSDQ